MNLKRILCNKIIYELRRKEIGIIVGPRQVGKTTLLKEVETYCKKQKIKYKYFNLETPADANYFGRSTQDILTDISNKNKVVLIDEFHYLPNATKLFKSVYDSFKGIKIYASGSSAIEMHKHLKESLAGRRLVYRVYSLSFSEWLPSKKSNIKLPKDIHSNVSTQSHNIFKKYLNEYIIYGGMPGLVHERNKENRKRLLIDLVSTYIQKDIKALLREEDILSFNRLINLLAGQEGGLLSENSISQTLNYSLRQVRKDIAILSQMFILDVLKPFFTNHSRELKQTNKIYYFDSGIRNAILSDFRDLNNRQDKGVLQESFVLHEIQKNIKISQEIYYWRTREKFEVDFILVQDRIPIPIEVKSKIFGREVPSGIKNFIDKYPETEMAVVLNNDIKDIIRYKNKKVVFFPHYYAMFIPELYNDKKIIPSQNFCFWI